MSVAFCSGDTFTVQINANADDGAIYGSWTWYSDREHGGVDIGDAYTGTYPDDVNYWAFCRFTLSQAIPEIANIINARLQWYGHEKWQWDDADDYLRIFVTDSADASAPSAAGDRPTIDGGATVIYPNDETAGVRWPTAGSLNNWDIAGWNTSVDFSSLIQYLVNKNGGLASGSHLCVWTCQDAPQGANNSSEVGWRLYEGGAAQAAKLTIEYGSEVSYEGVVLEGVNVN